MLFSEWQHWKTWLRWIQISLGPYKKMAGKWSSLILLSCAAASPAVLGVPVGRVTNHGKAEQRRPYSSEIRQHQLIWIHSVPHGSLIWLDRNVMLADRPPSGGDWIKPACLGVARAAVLVYLLFRLFVATTFPDQLPDSLLCVSVVLWLFRRCTSPTTGITPAPLMQTSCQVLSKLLVSVFLCCVFVSFYKPEKLWGWVWINN